MLDYDETTMSREDYYYTSPRPKARILAIVDIVDERGKPVDHLRGWCELGALPRQLLELIAYQDLARQRAELARQRAELAQERAS